MSRQAVLVIHGMGEQRPMATLRSFMKGVVAGQGEDSLSYFSKPDTVSDSFELRRYTLEASRTRPPTDFYEFYWADKMAGNTLRHAFPLYRNFMRQPIRGIAPRVRLLWVASWVLLAVLVLMAAMTAARSGPLALLGSPQEIVADMLGLSRGGSGSAGNSGMGGWVALGALGLAWVLSRFVKSAFGDVARYLDNSPGNVGVRHDIKSSARDVLGALHRDGRYERIVVVGHSLGSIIALDMLASYWAVVHERHTRPVKPDQSALKALEAMGGDFGTEKLDEYLLLQSTVLGEQRRHGVRWLVSDFVSVGSPLSHADWLLANGPDSLADLLNHRELPRNPPAADGAPPYSYRNDYDVMTEDPEAGRVKRRRSIFVLHHAALFACTRWTNIWFPCRLGLFGDPFGGPIRHLFGPGVVDRPVESGNLWTRFAPVQPHTNYFKVDQEAGSDAPSGHHLSLLREAMRLAR